MRVVVRRAGSGRMVAASEYAVTVDKPARGVSLDATGPQGPPGPEGPASTVPGPAGPEGPEGPAGGLSTRATATITTASLANNATETGTLTLAPSYRLLRIATSVPARVRLYVSTAARTADLARPVGTDPTGDHGLQLEMVTTSGDLDWGMSPTVDGFLDTGSDVPYAVTNMSGATSAVTVQLVWIATEAWDMATSALGAPERSADSFSKVG